MLATATDADVGRLPPPFPVGIPEPEILDGDVPPAKGAEDGLEPLRLPLRETADAAIETLLGADVGRMFPVLCRVPFPVVGWLVVPAEAIAEPGLEAPGLPALFNRVEPIRARARREQKSSDQYRSNYNTTDSTCQKSNMR